MFAQLSNPGRRKETAVFATAISQVHARVGGWARKCRTDPTREGIGSGRPAEFVASGRSGRRPVGSGRGLDPTPVAPATSSRWLLVRLGPALRLRQPRRQYPHKLRRRRRPDLGPGRLPGGASRSSASRDGAGVPGWGRARESVWIGPARRHALKGRGDGPAFLVGRLGHVPASGRLRRPPDWLTRRDDPRITVSRRYHAPSCLADKAVVPGR